MSFENHRSDDRSLFYYNSPLSLSPDQHAHTKIAIIEASNSIFAHPTPDRSNSIIGLPFEGLWISEEILAKTKNTWEYMDIELDRSGLGDSYSPPSFILTLSNNRFGDVLTIAPCQQDPHLYEAIHEQGKLTAQTPGRPEVMTYLTSTEARQILSSSLGVAGMSRSIEDDLNIEQLFSDILAFHPERERITTDVFEHSWMFSGMPVRALLKRIHREKSIKRTPPTRYVVEVETLMPIPLFGKSQIESTLTAVETMSYGFGRLDTRNNKDVSARLSVAINAGKQVSELMQNSFDLRYRRTRLDKKDRAHTNFSSVLGQLVAAHEDSFSVPNQ